MEGNEYTSSKNEKIRKLKEQSHTEKGSENMTREEIIAYLEKLTPEEQEKIHQRAAMQLEIHKRLNQKEQNPKPEKTKMSPDQNKNQSVKEIFNEIQDSILKEQEQEPN